MDVIKKESTNNITLLISGRIETGTSPELEFEINKVIDKTKMLILDFENVEFISSAGLRVIISAQKSCNANGTKLQIINPNEVVKEVFSLTGFYGMVDVR